MKGEWYLPIRLIPDNGLLLKVYLVVLHLGCGVLLHGVVPLTVFALSGITLVILLSRYMQGIVGCRQVDSLSILPGHQVILRLQQRDSERVRLLCFRLFAGFAFLRVLRSGRVLP